MFASEIMTRDVIGISDAASVRDAIRRLAEYRISGMPVVDRQQRLVGIVTEADVLGFHGDETTAVTEIMTRHVIAVSGNTPTDQIAQLLTSHRIKRVPVVAEERVVGIVSRGDLVRVLASRWTCGVCGAIHLGAMPQECDACGAPGTIFGRQLDPRPEISWR
jgi:CBS-domain-containing membrane protein